MKQLTDEQLKSIKAIIQAAQELFEANSNDELNINIDKLDSALVEAELPEELQPIVGGA